MKRRHFLQNMSLGAGATLLSPVLRQVHADAQGGPPPARFVFVVESNGRLPEFFQPTGIEGWKATEYNRNSELVDAPLTGANTFPKGFQALEPYRDRVTVLQGLSGLASRGGGTHSSNFGCLGAYPGRKGGDSSRTGGAYGETIDAALAKALPATFPLTVLGISRDPQPGMVYNASAWDEGQPVATICHPHLAYGAIFGSVAQGRAGQQFRATRNLLDFMVDDIKRVERLLSGAELEKFEQHVAAYQALQDRQSRLNDIEHTLREHAPVLSDKYVSEVESDRLDAHFDLAAAALIGGLTQVVTIASGTGNAHMSIRFRGLGIEVAKHELGHGQSDNGRSADECLDIIRGFHMELIVRLMKKLQAVPEGSGTMLDNTLIVFLSDAPDRHHASFAQWPVWLIGDLGGRLAAGGRFLGYPSSSHPAHRTMGNFYLTLLAAIGAEGRRQTFGESDLNLPPASRTGPLEQLLAAR